MREVVVYVEGGGPTRLQQKEFRTGLDQFFISLKKLADDNDCRLTFSPRGGIEQVLADFDIAYNPPSTEIYYLLVDSDGPVISVPRNHLKTKFSSYRFLDDKKIPDNRIHLMVQVMESWFIADISALERFFGEGFDSAQIPQDQEIESIDGDVAINSLKSASKGSSRGEYKLYSTIEFETGILKQLNPDILKDKAPHCKRLFEILELEITNTIQGNDHA
jgi:hypothetical protein